MDFFKRQEQARKQTALLLLYAPVVMLGTAVGLYRCRKFFDLLRRISDVRA